VYDKIILEVKSKESISNEHIAQTINYLKLSGCHLGIIVNFGRSKLEIKRFAN
jgi:GxxExxY protein